MGISPRPLRWLTMWAAVLACCCTGWQTSRAVDGQEWSKSLAVGALIGAIVTAGGILAWTWVVVENARRVLGPGRTEHPVSPGEAVLAWVAPMIVAVGAAAAVVFLQERLHESAGDDSSPVPLAVAGIALVVALLMAYRPLFILSNATRRLGGGSVEMSRMFWIPVTLLIVGFASLVVMRTGGAYGEEFDGLAPAWALGAVAIPPAAFVLVLAWKGAVAAEEAVDAAFARRDGTTASLTRPNGGLLGRLLRADPLPPVERDLTRRVRLVPGLGLTRLAVVTFLAALALTSIVGAVVMFLFWRESAGGGLLATQATRAWDALDALRRIERLFAIGLLAIVTVWAFVNVLNARLASGRRRNPFLAAASWPAAAYGIWRIADRVGGDERILVIVGGFALQAAILYVPFFLLERAASSVGALRHPLRVTYALGVILLVQTQGLAGLSTLDSTSSGDQFGRLAGYLALTAFVELLATLAITESSRLIGDAARHEADRHNHLVAQREEAEERLAAKVTGSQQVVSVGSPVAGSGPLTGTEPTADPVSGSPTP